MPCCSIPISPIILSFDRDLVPPKFEMLWINWTFPPIHSSNNIIFILCDIFDPFPGGKVNIQSLVKRIEFLIPIIIWRKFVVWRLIRGSLRVKKLQKGVYVHYIHITYVTVFTGVNVRIQDPECSFSFSVRRSGDIWNFEIPENIWRKRFGARPSGKSFHSSARRFFRQLSWTIKLVERKVDSKK